MVTFNVPHQVNSFWIYYALLNDDNVNVISLMALIRNRVSRMHSFQMQSKSLQKKA